MEARADVAGVRGRLYRPEWRKINRIFLESAKGARNLRFSLIIDSMNPFRGQGNSHSTWPITLRI